MSQTLKHSRPYRRIKRNPSYRYQVLYVDSNGGSRVFGETNSSDGGMALVCAKLLAWCKHPYVTAKAHGH